MPKYLSHLCMNPTMDLSKRISTIHDAIRRDEDLLARGETHIGEWELEDHLEFLNDELIIYGKAMEAAYEASTEYKN